jgi:acyl carrier protein
MTMTSSETAPSGAADDVTRLIRQMFEQAAGHDDFTDGESFFHIGGNSLTGLRLVHRLGESIGVQVPMRALFDHSTVEALSAYAAALAAGSGGGQQ